MPLFERFLLHVRRPSAARPLYTLTMNHLAAGDLPAARVQLQALRGAALTPTDQGLLREASIWALLCEGSIAPARDMASTITTSSPLLLAVLGVVAGTSEGALKALADVLCKTPALDLTTRALVSCRRIEGVAALVEQPGFTTRVADLYLQSASAIVFHAGAFEHAERICNAAFRAYGSPMHMYNAACCAARRNDIDTALAHLRQARTSGWNDPSRIFSDPDLRAVAEDPRSAEFR